MKVFDEMTSTVSHGNPYHSGKMLTFVCLSFDYETDSLTLLYFFSNVTGWNDLIQGENTLFPLEA